VIRTNLSTRPFYNERAVHVVLVAAGVLVVALTAYNAVRIITLSRANAQLSAAIGRDRGEAQRVSTEAQTVRAGIDQNRLKAIADAAASANVLIDQRTFSWTELFNHLEHTLPPDVMLTSVQPSFTRSLTTIQMAVLGRRAEDIDEFMEKLEATGVFEDVLPLQEDRTEQGLHRATLRAVYMGAGGPPGDMEPEQEPEPEPEPEPGAPSVQGILVPQPPAGVGGTAS